MVIKFTCFIVLNWYNTRLTELSFCIFMYSFYLLAEC